MNLTARHALLLGFVATALVTASWCGGRSTAAKQPNRPNAIAPSTATAPLAVPDDPIILPTPARHPQPPVSQPIATVHAVAPPPSAPAAPPANDLVTRTEAQLASEPADRAWAGPMAQKLTEGLRHASLEGVDVRSIECRATTCRVSLHYASAATGPRKVFEATCIGPTAEWSSLHLGCFLGPADTARDGSGDGDLFVFRDGQMPP